MPTLYLQCPCGEPIAVKRWRAGKRDCVPCGLARGIRHSRELHEKNGPGYEVWRAKMLDLLLDNNSDNGGSENGNPG